MKQRKLLIGGSLIFILLLAACSGGANVPVEPHNDPPPTESPDEDPTPPATEPAAQPTLEQEIEPTPSVLFEQSYAANSVSDRDYSEYDIVTLLPPDGIPALTNPNYYGVSGADKEYDPDEMVIGIEFNGDARAYSVGLLSSHEIVNDTVGGIHLAVTW